MSSDVSNRRLLDILTVLKRHHLSRGMTPQKLKEILEDLGPTYVKLGQIMSMRSDMLPEAYCTELKKLRTEVKPLDFSLVKQVVEQELCRPLESVFSEIQPDPLGSASIAQVHLAVLADGGRVVIKVQRPHIRETMENDIHLLKKAAKIMKIAMGTGDLIDFHTILDELWKTSQEEMDFIREADNLVRFYEHQKDIAYVTCPQVLTEFTTPRLLTMTYIDGIQIDHIDALRKAGYDMTEIGEKAAENYCKQILEDGFFHADPHPGNLWIAGGKIAWLDLGMPGHLSEHYKQLLRKAITALLMHDIYTLKNVLLTLGEPKDRINHARLYTDVDDIVSRYMTLDFGEMRLGDLIEKLLDLVKKHKIAISPDITLLGRSMITMEGTLAACSPEVNMLSILSMHMSSMIYDHFNWKKELIHRGRTAYASLDKSMEIPSQLSDLLNITKNGQTKLNMELTDANDFMKTFRQSVGYLVLGIVSSALFLGAVLLCMTELRPLIFGIPWISFIGFVLSGLIIVYLLYRILFRPKY